MSQQGAATRIGRAGVRGRCSAGAAAGSCGPDVAGAVPSLGLASVLLYHEVGFTKKLKLYFSKTDFAVCERKNEKYCTASGLAFALNATG